MKDKNANDDRYQVFATEGVYGTIEVKQTMSENTLDEAMGKLVTTSRLHRPLVNVGHYSENRRFSSEYNKDLRTGNPFYTGIIASRLQKNTTWEDVLDRFISINRRLDRHEMVRSICVLGVGCAVWAHQDAAKEEFQVAMFDGQERNSDLFLVQASLDYGESPLAAAVSNLIAALNRVVLDPTDIAQNYGAGRNLKLHSPRERYVVQIESEQS